MLRIYKVAIIKQTLCLFYVGRYNDCKSKASQKGVNHRLKDKIKFKFYLIRDLIHGAYGTIFSQSEKHGGKATIAAGHGLPSFVKPDISTTLQHFLYQFLACLQLPFYQVY